MREEPGQDNEAFEISENQVSKAAVSIYIAYVYSYPDTQ